MSTKTIAVDSRVYKKLAAAKLESESFSKTIDRLIEAAASAHSGRDILGALHAYPELSEEDAAKILSVVRENREHEVWGSHDLS